MESTKENTLTRPTLDARSCMRTESGSGHGSTAAGVEKKQSTPYAHHLHANVQRPRHWRPAKGGPPDTPPWRDMAASAAGRRRMGKTHRPAQHDGSLSAQVETYHSATPDLARSPRRDVTATTPPREHPRRLPRGAQAPHPLPSWCQRCRRRGAPARGCVTPLPPSFRIPRRGYAAAAAPTAALVPG